MTTQIGKTADITLLTALPGSGKTLRMVGFIKRAVASGEVVFVSNLNGLKLPHIPMEDPREWETLPAGSVLVVDEAQQFFRARRGGEAPSYLTAMETIRHKGVRLVLATQQPDYLDMHLRGLVGLHEHLVRENGKEAAKIFRHNEIMDNVRSERARNRYDSEVWQFPKEDYELYDSAEVHTRKRVLSSKFKRGVMFASAAAVLLAVAAYRFPGVLGLDAAGVADAQAAESSGREAAALPAASGAPGQGIETAGEWAARFQPRIPQVPMSAPAYDGREIAATPRIACGIGATMGCVCFTEQGTRYDMDQFACTEMVRSGGIYDPFRAPDDRPEPVEAEPVRGDVVAGVVLP